VEELLPPLLEDELTGGSFGGVFIACAGAARAQASIAALRQVETRDGFAMIISPSITDRKIAFWVRA